MQTFPCFHITKIFEVLTPHHTVNEVYARQNRPCYGLSLATDGEIVYHHNGKDYVSDAGHMMLIPKGADYTWDCTKTGAFTLLNFDTDISLNDTEFVSIKVDEPQRYLRLHKKIEQLYLFHTPQYYAEMLSLCYSMISDLLKQSEHSGIYPILRPALALLENHLGDASLSNNRFAEAAGISEVYFRKLFHQCFGMSPHQYLVEARIKKAKTMLENGVDALEEIAHSCGFQNHYYFFKVFKEKAGETPSEYRSRHSMQQM